MVSFLFVILLLLTVQSFNAADVNKSSDTVKKDYKTQSSMKSLEKNNKVNIDKNDYKKIINTTKKQKVKKSINKSDTTTKNQDINKLTKKIQTNKKEASSTVNTFTELRTLLRDSTDSELTVDLDGDETYTHDGNVITVNAAVNNLIINGNNHIINGNFKNKKFLSLGASNVTINNLIVKNCGDKSSATVGGGAIYQASYGNLTINNSIFDGCYYNYSTRYTTNGGGAIAQNTNCNLIINNSSLTNNSAHSAGGVIYQKSNSNITIINSNITDNCLSGTGANRKGGAIYQDTDNFLSIINSNITRNSPVRSTTGRQDAWAGAVYQNNTGTMIIKDSNVSSNTAYTNVGAIYQGADSNLTINNSLFKDNTYNVSSTRTAGAIRQVSGLININNSEFISNGKSNAAAGAIVQEVGNMNVDYSNFTSNMGGYCACLYQLKDSNLTILNSNFTDNLGQTSGSVVTHDESNNNLTITNSNFINNRISGLSGSSSIGGVIYQASNNEITIIGTNITDSQASGGGVISQDNGSNLTIINSTILNSNATGGSTGKSGGAILQGSTCTLNITNSSISNCFAQKGSKQVSVYGGAICQGSNGIISISYSNITNSSVTSTDSPSTAYGGAISQGSNGNLTIIYSNLEGNDAKSSGGAIYQESNSNFTIMYSNITTNHAIYRGGAIYISSGSTGYIVNNTFKDNWLNGTITDENYVLVLRQDMTVVNNTFINNTDNQRDMLFNILVREVHDNVYIDNYLNDTIETIPDATITGDYKDTIKLLLRNVYNDTIRNGNVSLYTNDALLGTFDVVDGEADIEIKFVDLPQTVNVITVNYTNIIGSKHYQNMTKTFKLTKNYIQSIITVSCNESVKVGQIVTINGTLTQNNDKKTPIKGTVSLYINKTLINTNETGADGKYVFYYTTTSLGIQNVTVNYTGSYNILNCSNTTKFTVSSIKTNSTISATNVIIGKNTTISGVLYDVENNEKIKNTVVTIKIDDDYSTQVQVNNEGKFELSYNATRTGEHTVKVIYKSDNILYSSSTNETKFTVSPRKTNMTIVNNASVIVGQVVTVNGTLKDELGDALKGAFVNVTVGDVLIENVPVDKNGFYSAECQVNVVGTIPITVRYTNDTMNYTSSVNGSSVVVNPRATNMTVVNNASVIVGQVVTVNGTLKDELGDALKGAFVNVIVGDVLIENVPVDKNGFYSVECQVNVVGTISITVMYTNDTTNYTSSVNGSSVVVNPRATNMTIVNKASVYVGENLEISGILRDELNEIISNTVVSIIIGNYYVEENVEVDSNGKYCYIYKTTEVGEQSIKVKYISDNPKYMSSTNTSSFKVIDLPPLSTSISINAASTKVGNKSLVKGKLIDEENKPVSGVTVTILLNNKDSYNATTGSDGTYSQYVPASVVGVNNVSVSFNGNKYYKKSENKTTFNVEKMDTKLSLDSISDSKVGDKVTVKGYLMDENNYLLPGQTVTIKVNDKAYNVTTASDGSYSKTITASVAGKNKVSVSYSGNDKYLSSSNNTNYNVEKLSTKITLNKINDTTVGEKAKVTGKLLDENGKAVSNVTIKVTVNGKTYTAKTGSDGSFSVSALTNSSGKLKVKAEYSGSDKYSSSSATRTVTVNKIDVIVKVKSVTAIVGENMTLTATVTDKKGNKVTGGNVIFKLNGVSFNSKKRFDNSSSTPYKFSVKNGKVSFKISTDYYLKNGGNITATYSGTDTHKNVISKAAKLTVKLRNMKITVQTKPSRVKQYKNITFTATITDTTKNAKNKTALFENSYVLFKIDGKTIKVKGKTANVTVKSNKVTYKYTIPRGTPGIYVKRNIRYYNVTAVYGSKLFYMDNNSANTNYTVARSKITVTVNKAVLKSKKLSIKGTIKDYMKKYLKGTNKVCIKIDGETYKIKGKVQYYEVKNGRINLKNIKISNPSSVKTVSVVSGDRVAYLQGQSKAKKIVKL